MTDDYEGEFPITEVPPHLTTRVFYAEAAHISARFAWIYPQSDQVREEAIAAAAVLGVNYIDAVASAMENTNCSPDHARYVVAEAFRTGALKLAAAGG